MGLNPVSASLDAQMAEAEVLYQQQRYQAAQAADDRLLQTCPSTAEAHDRQAWIHYHTSQDGAALSAFRKAVGLAPGLVEAQLGLGQAAYYLDLNAKAGTPLKPIIALNSHQAPAHSYLGASCFRQYRYVAAIPSLENAALLDPHDTEGLAMLGRSLVLTGRP